FGQHARKETLTNSPWAKSHLPWGQSLPRRTPLRVVSFFMNLKAIWELIKAAGSAWVKDNDARLGAALSYYTIFAIPPLFVIVIFVASLFLDATTVRTDLFGEVGGLIGKKGADAIHSALSMSDPETKRWLAS